MCQSKAQGGKRCAAYLEQQVTTGLVATTAAMTGTKRAEMSGLHADLAASATDGPDPTREEVDQFLTETDFRVRHDPTLDKSVRESLSARLRAAIGKILPSRQTLTAWRGMLSEAWARSHRKATTGFAAMAVVFSVGACGTTPDEGQAVPASSEPTSQIATDPSPSETTSAPAKTKVLEPSEGTWGKDPNISIGISPREFFGAEKAAAGAELALTFLKEYSVHEDMVAANPRNLSMSGFDGATANMSPSLQADLSKTVAAFSQSRGKKEAGAMWAFSVSSVDSRFGPDITYRVDRSVPDPVSDRQFTSISVRLSPNKSLEVATTSTFVLRFKDTDGSIYSGQYKRETRQFLVPSGDSWLIDGYRGGTTFEGWV